MDNTEEEKNGKKAYSLLENFLSNGNYNSFKKMLIIEPNKKTRLFKSKNPIQISNNQDYKKKIYSKTENLSSPLIENEKNLNYGFREMILERHLDYVDAKYRNKCLKGNYENYFMNYNHMKKNWAKRKGISYDNFQIPKIESYRREVYENLYNKNFLMKNKGMNNVITPEDVIQKKYQESINKYNSNIHGKFLFPKININNPRIKNLNVKKL
jgi:hypothetical protein